MVLLEQAQAWSKKVEEYQVMKSRLKLSGVPHGLLTVFDEELPLHEAILKRLQEKFLEQVKVREDVALLRRYIKFAEERTDRVSIDGKKFVIKLGEFAAKLLEEAEAIVVKKEEP